MDELWEAMSWAQIGYHAKPVGLLNVAGYYDGLIAFAEKMGEVGFLRPQHRGLLIVGRHARRIAGENGGVCARHDDRADRCEGSVTTRAALVATAGETIARGSKSFAAASRLFRSGNARAGMAALRLVPRMR